MNAPTFFTVRIDRDSVHPADDDSHASTITISASSTLADLLKAIREMNFIPGIMGGEATWVVSSSTVGGYIGVVAQQWQEPKLTVPLETSVNHLGSSGNAKLYFRYWCQADPDVVFSCVRTGRELPGRYK